MHFAESAGIVKPADFFSYADETADTLNGNHQRAVGETHAASLARKQWEKQLLF